MKLQNPWVGYLDRTYDAIKESILRRLRTSVPEVTDLNNSNLLVILASIFSGLMEQVGFYGDNNARESYLGTARKFSSVVKLVKILDYRIKASLPASVDLYFTYVDAAGEPVNITESAIIPAGTAVNTASGLQFLTLETVELVVGQSFAKVTAKQWEYVPLAILGVTTSADFQEYSLPVDYAHDTLNITINGIPWSRVNTLALSMPTDKHFIVDVDANGVPKVVFGNNTNGEIPPANQDINSDYYITEGLEGNLVSRGLINELSSALVLPDPATGVRIRNELPPVSGSGIEDIESIRYNAPFTTKTIERAVTREDFNYLAQRASGVGKASVVYDCGKNIEVYISPSSGGLASDTLLNETLAYLNGVKMITTNLIIKAAGETPVAVGVTINPRFRVDMIALRQEVVQALTDTFSFKNNQINGRIAISDVLSIIDNLSKVDTVELDFLYTMPYAFPFEHNDPLNWDRETLPGSTGIVQWTLAYTGTDFRLLKEGTPVGNAPLNTVYTDPEGIIQLRVNSGGMYEIGQNWNFTTYPYNRTIRLTDNTIPILTEATLDITINQPT